MKDYNEALSIADSNRHKMVQNSDDSALLELTFLTSLGYYYTGEIETAYTYFKNTFYALIPLKAAMPPFAETMF